jgi:CRISPR type III-B/RAMP module-associated protein Cmr5
MATEVKRKSIEQQRAKYAWNYVQESEPPKDPKQKSAVFDKYKSHVREFPMLVLTCGLVNAVAFAYEKGGIKNGGDGDKGWKLVYQHLENWLKKDCGVNHIGDKRLLHGLLDIPADNLQKMRFLTNETIALFSWIKRFVS